MRLITILGVAALLGACSGTQPAGLTAPSANKPALTGETSGGNGPSGNPVGPATGISLSDDPPIIRSVSIGADFRGDGTRVVGVVFSEDSRGGPTQPCYTFQFLREPRFQQAHKVTSCEVTRRGDGLLFYELTLKPGTYKVNIQRENVSGTFSSQGDRSRDFVFTVEEGPNPNHTADCHYLGDGVWQPTGCGVESES